MTARLRTATVTVKASALSAKEAKRMVAAYLPTNYTVVGVKTQTRAGYASAHVVTIQGIDSLGWTLDDYVLPRLASGMIFGKEN